MSSSVFDWYQCSIFDDDGQNLHSRVVLCLLNNLDLVTTQPIKALHGYQEALAICRGTHTVCRLMWGGNPGVNVWATGENARLVAPLIRQFFPNHKVTRDDFGDLVCYYRGGAYTDDQWQQYRPADPRPINPPQQPGQSQPAGETTASIFGMSG